MLTRQKLSVISLTSYITSAILMFVSTYFFFRTFLKFWFFALIAFCVLCGISTIGILFTSGLFDRTTEETQEEAEVIKTEVNEFTEEPLKEDVVVTPTETAEVVTAPVVESNPVENEETPSKFNGYTESNLNKSVKEVQNELTRELKNISPAVETSSAEKTDAVKPAPRKINSYNTLEDLKIKAKEKRSKEDVIVSWRILNPYGTQRECAKDLDLSIKTVRKWWNSY